MTSKADRFPVCQPKPLRDCGWPALHQAHQNCSILQWVGRAVPCPPWVKACARLPVWELRAALGLCSGRRGRLPGEATAGPGCVSHGQRSPQETHRGITGPTPLPHRTLPAGTETCSTAATLVIRVGYRAASSSVSWLLPGSGITLHYHHILPQSLATAKSRGAPEYWPVRALLARFLKSDVRPLVCQAIAWLWGSQW